MDVISTNVQMWTKEFTMAKKVEVKVEPMVKFVPIHAKVDHYPHAKDEGMTIHFYEGGIKVVAIQNGIYLPALDLTWQQIDEARCHVSGENGCWL